MHARPDASSARTAANGLTEYLIAHSVDDLRPAARARLSLNFAAFGRLLDNDVQLTRVDRLLRRSST